MRTLAFDIGTRRTGVAFFDDQTGIVLPLETLEHTSSEECLTLIKRIAAERKVVTIVLGLPLLLSGTEGSQVGVVRAIGMVLEKEGFDVSYVDERYSSPTKNHHKNADPHTEDGDAEAACEILRSFLKI